MSWGLVAGRDSAVRNADGKKCPGVARLPPLLCAKVTFKVGLITRVVSRHGKSSWP